jgi:cytochrome P450
LTLSTFDIAAFLETERSSVHDEFEVRHVHVDGNDFYLTARPEWVRAVFTRTDEFIKGRSWDAFRALFGRTSTTVERPDAAWRDDRVLLSGFFKSPLDAAYADVVSEAVDACMRCLADKGSEVLVEDGVLLARGFMLDVVARVVLGVPSDDRLEALADVFQRVVPILSEEFTSTEILSFSARAASLGTSAWRVEQAAERLRWVLAGFAKRSLACNASTRPGFEPYVRVLAAKFGADASAAALPPAFLDELVMVFVAGYESASRLIANTLAALGRESACSRELHSRLKRLDAKSTRALVDCAYLGGVIQETLRLWPITPQMVKDVAIGGAALGSHSLAAGSRAVVLIDRMQRSHRHWLEPDAFRPERFSRDCTSGAPVPAFAPFGTGPRVCPGRSAALFEVKLFVARLVLSYDIESDPDVRHRGRMFLTPQESIRLVLTSR